MAEFFEFSNNGGTTWLNLNNVEDFGSANTIVTLLKSGWGMPRTRHLSVRTPGQDGVTILDTVYDSRNLQLGIHVRGLTRNDMYSFRHSLARKLRKINSVLGKLRYTYPDGTQRQIDCDYVGGLGFASNQESHLGKSFRDTIRFFAPSPFWYNPAQTVETLASVTPITTTTYPLRYPRGFTSSDLFTTTTITNNGDIEIGPIFTINGPCSNIVLTNNTTQKTLTIDIVLIVGETIHINTEFGFRSAEKTDGFTVTNIFHTISGDFWTLDLDNNEIDVSVIDASNNTEVIIKYFDKYLVA